MALDASAAPLVAAARARLAGARSARAIRSAFAGQSALLAFLLAVSVPIILPYFWMVVISFTARSGGVATDVLWTACAVIVPAVLIYSAVHSPDPVAAGAACRRPDPARRLQAPLLAALVGGQLHLANYRFLWRTDIIEEIRSKATAGGAVPIGLDRVPQFARRWRCRRPRSSSPSRRWPVTTSRASPSADAKPSSRACSCCTPFRR